MSNQGGVLYIVATPIGNLEDIGRRAARLLAEVGTVAAEDTRHSARLLAHLGVQARLLSLHEHNEERQLEVVLDRLVRGESVALVSDAGTPLVSDPGYRLVRAAQERGLRVVPVPGASSPVTALSAAGLASDRFAFEGFLAAKAGARRRQLEMLREESRTLIFFESPHRIVECLKDMADVLGGEREAAVARELTKTFETIRRAPLAELAAWVERDPDQRKGEFVLLVAGCAQNTERVQTEGERVLAVLLEDLPVKQAAALAAKISGDSRNRLYKLALEKGRAQG